MPTSTTQDSLPQVVQDVLGYEIFTIEDGTPLELDSAYGEKFAQETPARGTSWPRSQDTQIVSIQSSSRRMARRSLRPVRIRP